MSEPHAMTAAHSATGVARIAAAFAACRRERRAALIAYLAAGDPDLEVTEALALSAVEAGADMLELGVPFSDPLADGPVIQAAYTRALAAGTTVAGVLRTVERIAAATDVPIVLMSAFNPVLAYGVAEFCADAAAAGAAGALVPDLLPEDADRLCEAAARHGLATVFLSAPATAPARVAAAAAAATGFLYLVSRTGVTGPAGGVGSAVAEAVARARGLAHLPIAVGFGVSSAADARRVAALADGVIVGSSLVQAAADAFAGAGATDRQHATRAAAAAVRARVGTLARAMYDSPSDQKLEQVR